MNDMIDFRSVMVDLNLNTKQKYGNYQCPFCQKKSFTVYPENQLGYCHNCNWSGNAIKLYSEWKNVSYNEAMSKLGRALQNGSIQLKEQTYAEAKDALAKDLEFLAWVRMYEGFYPDQNTRFNRKIFEDKTGVTKGTLSKIINGQMCNALTWRKVLSVLHSDLDKPIEQLKKHIALGTKYFEEQLVDDQRGADIKKYQIKKSRIKNK